MNENSRRYGTVDKVPDPKFTKLLGSPETKFQDRNIVGGYWIWASIASVGLLAAAYYFAEKITLSHAALDKSMHDTERISRVRQVDIEVEINLLSFNTVREYLEDNGVDWMTDDETELYKYVPRKMTLVLDPSLVQQNIGEAAVDGFVVFNIANYDRLAALYHCSWTIVIDLFGNIQRITPGTVNDGKASWVAGLKLKSPDKILISEVLSETDENGPVMLYDWPNDVMETLVNGSWGCSNSAHDARYGYENSKIIWRPCTDYLLGQNSVTGDTFETSHPDGLHDINHLQVLEANEMIISSRMDNQFAKYNWHEDRILWRVGGTNGSFNVHSEESGHYFPAGENFMYGQHNVEYYGEGEYFLFDNQFAAHAGQYMADQSRLLSIFVDSEANYAGIIWEFELGHQTPVFGDCDRLPSGNVLAATWTRNITKEINYDARIMEVTMAKEVAWDLQIFGSECSEDVCDRSPKGTPGDGWVIYSAERFYASTVIENATCTLTTQKIKTYQELTFTAYSPIKTIYPSNATYFVHDSSGRQIAYGAFTFSLHWRKTKINAVIDDFSCDGSILTVKDEWGNSADASIFYQDLT